MISSRYSRILVFILPFLRNAMTSEQIESNPRTHLVFMCFAAENINHSNAVLRFHMFSISQRGGSSEKKKEGDIIRLLPDT